MEDLANTAVINVARCETAVVRLTRKAKASVFSVIFKLSYIICW